MKTVNRLYRVRLCTLVLCALALYWGDTHAQVKHRVLIGGCGLGYVAIVNKDGVTEWQHPETRDPEDLFLLPNGNIIWTITTGVIIVKPDFKNPANDKIVWTRTTKSGGETHSCQPLDGSSSKFLIGESFDTISYIVEVDTTRELKRIALPRFGSGRHNQFRQIRKTPQKTYLVTQQQNPGGRAFEYDSTGKLLRTFVDGRYVAERLTNGNTLIACGDASRVIEVDAANKIVWEVGRDSLPNITLGFVAGVVRLANGNTVICNWGGHVTGTNLGASVIEITRDKRVVWSLNPKPEYRVSAVHVLDDATAVAPTAFPRSSSDALIEVSSIAKSMRYTIPTASRVTIRIYTVHGKLIKTVADSYQQAGNYRTTAVTPDLSNGFYVLQFKAGAFCKNMRIIQ